MADVIILSGGSYEEETSPRVIRSLGPYRIASELKKHGYSAVVIDYTQYMSAEEIINSISKHLDNNTLWLGYSSTFFFTQRDTDYFNNPLRKMYQSNPYDKISKIYDYIKQNSTAKIVFGGAYALLAHADPIVDYYIVGYADVSSLELTKYLSGKVETLQYYSEKIIDDRTCIIIDSGKYPDPEMNTLETNFKDYPLIPGEAIPVEFARGCIFKCKFCTYPLLGKKKGTYIRDMNQVRDELVELWEATGTDTYYITDDTFNDDNDKMEDFHKLFTSLPFKPKFSAFLRLDLIDRFPHQADLLLEAGLVGNFFGIESFNHKSARAIGKGLHPDRVKERLKWVREKWKGKVNTGIGLIIGLPYDDEKYFEELWDYIHSNEYQVQHTVFNPLFITDTKKGVNLYGSEFAMNPEIYGYKFNDDGWYHEEQNLDFRKCANIADMFSRSVYHKSFAPDFSVITYLSMGIPLEDIIKYPEIELRNRYNIPKLNNEKLTMYKQMIGAI